MKENPSLVSPEIWLSLATSPMLLVLLGGKLTSDLLQSIGQASEEVFRGERLPLQPFPNRSVPEEPNTEPLV